MSNTIVVVGAGVIGLTSALLLAKEGNSVTVVGKHMPGDYDAEYASPWAGANFIPLSPEEGSRWERRTWVALKKLTEENPEAGIHFQTTHILRRDIDMARDASGFSNHFYQQNPWYKSIFNNFRENNSSELAPGYDSGFQYQGVCINTAIYLPWLLGQCLKHGVVVKRGNLKNINEAKFLSHKGRVANIIVNATGLGSLKLGGVEDSTMAPSRGQIVVVRNETPKNFSLLMCSSPLDGSGEEVYAMQRAAGGGTILGGTYDIGNWNSQPDPNTALRIMQRIVDLCPDIAGGKGIAGLDVIRHGVGFRPWRKGGLRLEEEKLDDQTWIIHNYGHSGWGYMGSYGCAEGVVELVDKNTSTATKQLLLKSPNPNSVGSSSGGEDWNSVLPTSTASNVTSSEETTPTESTIEIDHKVTSSMLVDWTAETTPPDPDISVPDLDSAPAPKADPEVVLLTGCSGLLGHHLLNAFIAQPLIRKIICIAVRRLPERLETKRLPPSGGRVIYHEGDLSQSDFGLREKEWADIFSEVDAVIHNGSDTSHLKFYSALRQANVESTRKLVGACLRRSVPFHYVSSAGVALFAGLEAFPPASCTGEGKKPPVDGAHGYMCGKWTCERMLERLVERYPQQRVVVQRPSTIIREGDDAETDEAGLDWVNSLLYYSHKTRSVPRVDYNAGAFDLVYVETCCNDIVRELLRNAAQDPPKTDKGITFVNNVGDVVIPMTNMSEIGLKTVGRKYSVLPMPQWTKNVLAAGMHPAVAALIETFDEPGVDMCPRLLRE